MRRFYAIGQPIDGDDLGRTAAIAAGQVPESCRMGGPTLAVYSARGTDPCAACPVDRGVCGGRPATVSVSPGARADFIALDAAAAYEDLRRLQQRALEQHCASLPT